MNARQKAKKYKRMYEELLNSPVKFEMKQYKIDTLKFERFYPEGLIREVNSSYLREVIVKDVAQGLASNLGKYVNCKTEFCPHINKYRIYGEIKVVDRLYAESEDNNEL